jgi:hypothetical protein
MENLRGGDDFMVVEQPDVETSVCRNTKSLQDWKAKHTPARIGYNSPYAVDHHPHPQPPLYAVERGRKTVNSVSPNAEEYGYRKVRSLQDWNARRARVEDWL